MDYQHHMQPHNLERHSFLWSQARLVIAALALFLGGVPPLVYLRLPSGLLSTLLTVAWIISGLASAYLLYRWHKHGMKLFGHQNMMDRTAFLISTISGLNLGITGLTKNNIGMSISSNQIIFVIVGVLYLFAAYHLHKRWKESGKKLF